MNTQHPNYPKHRKEVQRFADSIMAVTTLLFALGAVYTSLRFEHKVLSFIVLVLAWIFVTSIAINVKDYFSRKKFDL